MALLNILLDRDSALQKRLPSPTRTTLVTSKGKRLIFDAATDISHEFTAKVTSFPVEDKSEVSDHIVNENPSFSVSGVFSDASLNILSIPNHYKQDIVYKMLLEVRDAKKTVSLITPLDIYSDLLLTSLSFPRTAGNGRALFVEMTFEKIRRVSNELTTVFVSKKNSVDSKTGDDKIKNSTEKDGGTKKGGDISSLKSGLETLANGYVVGGN